MKANFQNCRDTKNLDDWLKLRLKKEEEVHLLQPKMAVFLSSRLLINLSSSSPLCFLPNPHFTPHAVSIKHSLRNGKPSLSKSLIVPFALTESDSPRYLEPSSQSQLQELAVSSKFHLFFLNNYYFFWAIFPSG